MGGTQDPAPPPAYGTPGSPPPPAAPSGPSAMDTFIASMSRNELLLLAGAALMVIVDVLFWFLDGYGVSNTIFAAAAVVVVLVLARKSLPAALASMHGGLLLFLGIWLTVLGVRNFVLDVLIFASARSGGAAMFLLGMVAMLVATALVAYATWMMWRGRSA